MRRQQPYIERIAARKANRDTVRINLQPIFKRSPLTKRYTAVVHAQFQKDMREHLHAEYHSQPNPASMAPPHVYPGGCLSAAARNALGFNTATATKALAQLPISLPPKGLCYSSASVHSNTSIRLPLRFPTGSHAARSAQFTPLLPQAVLDSDTGDVCRLISPLGRRYRKRFSVAGSHRRGCSAKAQSASNDSGIDLSWITPADSTSGAGYKGRAGDDADDWSSDMDDAAADGDDEATPNSTPNKMLGDTGGDTGGAHRSHRTQRRQRRHRNRLPLPEPWKVLEMSAGRYMNVGLARLVERYSTDWPAGQPVELTVAVYAVRSNRKDHQSNQHSEQRPLRHLVLLGRLTAQACVDQPSGVSNQRRSAAFVIGVYEGGFGDDGLSGNEIFAPFVAEMQQLEMHGLRRKAPYTGTDAATPVVLRAFVCDPLSAALLSCSVQPTHRNGCIKCIMTGERTGPNRPLAAVGLAVNTAYPPHCPDDCRRLDADFVHCLDGKFHLGRPICTRLATVRMSSSVQLDYKHVMCTGVMRRLWVLWTNGRLECRLNVAGQRRIARQLYEFGWQRPATFRCGPKLLADWRRWTGYDWRQFVLYYGPMVLRSELPPAFFSHFLCLHLAVRLATGEAARSNARVIGFLLRRFVIDMARLYGYESVDHSVHSLLHVEQTVLEHGRLENVGGFAFDGRLAQVMRRLGLGDESDEAPEVAGGHSYVVDDDEHNSDGDDCVGNDDAMAGCDVDSAHNLETLRDELLLEELMAAMPSPDADLVPSVNVECTLTFCDHRDGNDGEDSDDDDGDFFVGSGGCMQPDNYVQTPLGMMQVFSIRMYKNGSVHMLARRYRTVLTHELFEDSDTEEEMVDKQQEEDDEQGVDSGMGVLMPDRTNQLELFVLHEPVSMSVPPYLVA